MSSLIRIPSWRLGSSHANISLWQTEFYVKNPTVCSSLLKRYGNGSEVGPFPPAHPFAPIGSAAAFRPSLSYIRSVFQFWSRVGLCCTWLFYTPRQMFWYYVHKVNLKKYSFVLHFWYIDKNEIQMRIQLWISNKASSNFSNFVNLFKRGFWLYEIESGFYHVIF